MNSCPNAPVQTAPERLDEAWLESLNWDLLSSDGGLSRYRVQHGKSRRTWLAARPTAASSGAVERRLEQEFALREALDPDWAMVPLLHILSRNGPVLVYEDAGEVALNSQTTPALPFDNFLCVALGAAEALAQLHMKKLLHRDIKPGNLLLDNMGKVRLTGFGLSGHYHGESHLPPSDLISGTLAYMSPEQAGRVERQADARSDLYSLGITLYELLTGRLPFDAADAVGWVHSHVAVLPPPPSAIAGIVPPALDHVILKLIRKMPEERYQNAADAVAELRNCREEWFETRRIALSSPAKARRQDMQEPHLLSPGHAADGGTGSGTLSTFITALMQEARKAMDAASPVRALSYMAMAEALAGALEAPGGHATRHVLGLLHVECLGQTGAFAAAQNRAEGLQNHAATPHEHNAIHQLRIWLYLRASDHDSAAAESIAALARYGIMLSRQAENEVLASVQAALNLRLAGREIATLLELPMLRDDGCEAAMTLLASLLAPLACIDARLMFSAVSKLVELTLHNGLSAASVGGLAWYGVSIADLFGSYETGLQFAQLAVALCERHGFVQQQVSALVALGQVSAWTQPLTEAMDFNRAALAATESDMAMGCFAANRIVSCMLVMGQKLPYVEREIEQGLALAARAHIPGAYSIMQTQQQFVRVLRHGRGTTDMKLAPGDVPGTPFDSPMAPLAFRVWLLRGIGAYLYGDTDAAATCLTMAQGVTWSAPAHIDLLEFHFYAALTLVAQGRDGDDDEGGLAPLATHLARLRLWADMQPANFADRALLVDAERARLQGDWLAALALYEKSIRAAKLQDFTQVLALAHELAGQCCLVAGLTMAAQGHLCRARDAYRNWGADGKVQQLLAKHPHLQEEEQGFRTSMDIADAGDKLDILSALKASQTLSEEIVLDRLVESLMKNAITHAGAQCGVLLLLDGDQPRIEARGVVDMARIEIALARTEPTVNDLPLSILWSVQQTHRAVVVDDATIHCLFAEDPYFVDHPVRSILCLPLLKQGELLAMLYLENHLASGVFTSARTSTLELLAAQAAISLENARLYHELYEENARRKQTEAALQTARNALAQVAQRTAMGELAASIAHEINQPLTSIITNADATLRWLQRDVPDLQEALSGVQDIVLDGARARNIVKALRSLARQAEPELQAMRPDDIVRRVLELTATEVMQGGVTLRLDLNTDTLITMIDPVQFQQVALNLILNSIEAMAETDLPRVLSLTSKHEPNGGLALYVGDTGRGISADHASRIFEAFFTTKESGTGMGLAICRSIMKAHRGTLDLWKSSVEGSIFRLTLPGGAPE